MINHDTSNGTVVIVSSIHWDFVLHPHHNIAYGLAERGYQIYFIDPFPIRWWPGSRRLLQHLRSRITGKSMVHENLIQPVLEGIDVIKMFGAPEKYAPGIWFNSTVTARLLARTIRRRGIHHPLIIIHFIPLPYAQSLQENLAPDTSLYYAIWEFSNAPGGSDVAWNEASLAASVDRVLADSPYHVARMSRLRDEVAEILPAVNPAMFEPARSVDRPVHAGLRCGFYGTIDERIDLVLLREISHRYALRLIGPVTIELDGFSSQTEICGPQPYRDLPELLGDVDVLLFPYVKGQYIDAIIPAKTFECLATGKPTVVIGLSSLERYRDYFYLCEDHVEFLTAIETASHEDNTLPDRRIALANQNTWVQRIDQIVEEIDIGLAASKKTASITGPNVAYLSPSYHPYRVPVFEALNRKLNGQLIVFTLQHGANMNDELALALGDFPKQLIFGRRIDLLRHQQRGSGTALGVMMTPTLPFQLRSINPRIVISNNFNLWTLMSLLLGYRTIIFWEGTSHTERTVTGFRKSFRRWMAQRARGFVVNGESSQRYLTEHLGIDSRRIVTGGLSADPVPNGLVSRALTIRKPAGPVRFLFVGRLVELKGVEHLIEAFAIVNKRSSAAIDVELIIVGGGRQRKNLEALTTKLGISDFVTFVGYVTPDEVWHYYEQADVFVLPTLQDNWPLVVAEAMEAGMPVLLSKYAGSVPDLIDESKNGYEFDPRDHERLATLLEWYMQHLDFIAKHGRRSQEIISRYTPEHAADAFYQAITAVVEQDRQAAGP